MRMKLRNILNVLIRIESGGHSVPEDKITSRYYKTFDLAKEVVTISDICHIYDNSQESPRRFLKKEKEDITLNPVLVGIKRKSVL